MFKKEIPPRAKASLDSTKATYKQLGKSGLKVSVPVFGAMSFGSSDWADWVINEEKALPLLKAAYDKGINTWDTANMYSNGVSEEIIGKAIKKYNIPRHKIFVLTKCYVLVGDPEHENQFLGNFTKELSQSKDYVNQHGQFRSFNLMQAEKKRMANYDPGLSRQAIFSAVDASLKRMDLDYIDLLQIHRFDSTVPIEETMEALHDLVKSGKVRYIGASSMWAYQFAMMQACAEKHGWTKFISMQNHYSLMYREEEREMNKYCKETGVGIIPWGPLYAGTLARPASEHGKTVRSGGSGKVLDEADTAILNRVEELANKKGWKMSQVALAWISENVSSPIIGFSSIERIDEALDVKGKTLTEEERKYLEEPYKPKAIIGHS
ncbi:hypothetical protein FQN54_002173 [Arachnomyces sp. PD_36]|nr:hypothetical protein FQN54_002173 [Arachnomyces sp. PD_36]